MFQKAAEMISGGLTVCSSWAEDQSLYATTVIQLDGDVITAYSSQAVESPDFGLLKQRHLDEVHAALASLNAFGDFIAWLQHFLFSLAALYGVLTALASLQSRAWMSAAEVFFPLAVLAAAGSARQVCLVLVRWQVGRMVASTTRSAEKEYARRLGLDEP